MMGWVRIAKLRVWRAWASGCRCWSSGLPPIRQTLSGRTDTLFSTDAITLIHNASRGYPRTVNNLAVNTLTAAFARNNPIVDEKAARTAISETGTD
jgi:hypothetical protein